MLVATTPTASAPAAPPDASNAVQKRTRPAYQRFEPWRIVGTMTVDEWDVFLTTSKHKYDYVYGEVVQMAGASPEHNLIAMNTGRIIGNALEETDSDCEILGSDQRVYVRENLYYFPDLVVVCGEMQVDTRDAIRNPAALIEVLSPSTETNDRTDKFREYQSISSLRHYVLIDQNRVAVTHYEKIAGGIWAILGDYRDLSDSLTLTFGETSATVPVSRIYRNLSFSPPAVPSGEPESG
ncbi:MAG: Uma2 family endonuclease [Akkermansiaceae bacterium]|nr:Uma2 family endonuclease [Armatimonadota bacterium]